MIPIKVLLADDHAIVIEGLRRVLEPTFAVIGAVTDGRALVAATDQLKPDVVIADVSMPILNGIEAARQIRATNQDVRILFFTMHADVVYAAEALQAGGSGYCLKSSAGNEILTAIQEALAGRTYITLALDRRSVETQMRRGPTTRPGLNYLSLRQREVVQMAAQGNSSKQIAAALRISQRTVEFHRYHAMKSLGVHTLAELVQYAIKHQLIIL
jgi:DNA-binding NarL/FixJ family response regulator